MCINVDSQEGAVNARAVLIEVAWCDTIVASVWSSGMFPALGGGGFVLKQVNESRRFSIWRQWCCPGFDSRLAQ